MKTDKYLGVSFEKGGSLTHAMGNPIWMQFVRDFRSDLKKMLKDTGWTLHKLNNAHFYVSGFLHQERLNRWMYFSVPDVRYFQDDWSNSVLIRTAKSPYDYAGGMNCYTTFKKIPYFLLTNI